MNNLHETILVMEDDAQIRNFIPWNFGSMGKLYI